MIPQEKSAAVTQGLREAFGVTGFEDVRLITKGRTSSLVLRIVVCGTPYLLKINMRANSIGPERQFGCMQAAAGAGIAPHVRYTSVEDGISITDFVEEIPFPVSEALVRMPAVLRILHALPPFPGVENHFNTTCLFLLNPGPARDGFIQQFRASNILSKSEAGEFFGWLEQIAAVYPHDDADMVSSHNDMFKPDNILFDGQRVWLVDWEAAFHNDRYADLASVANLLITNDAEERAFLEAYFGEPPDAYQLARLFLMKQVAHIFYAMAFLSQGSREPVSQSENVPSFQDFQRRFWTGEVQLTDSHSKGMYGKVHWEQLLRNMGNGRFAEALRIVADRHRPS